MLPESKFSSPNNILKNVVFPTPLGPTRPIRIPRFIEIFAFINSFLSKNDFEILSRYIIHYN